MEQEMYCYYAGAEEEGPKLIGLSAIEEAVREKRAVLRWHHGNWENVASLVICRDATEAAYEAAIDTRGKCHSMSDEIWSERATKNRDAIRAAKGLLRLS